MDFATYYLFPKTQFKLFYIHIGLVLIIFQRLNRNQICRFSNDQDHADGHVDVSEGAIGNYCNVICLNASPASHGVSQHTIHSQVASKGTGAVNVDTVDMY
jgi:hypothetical protein